MPAIIPPPNLFERIISRKHELVNENKLLYPIRLLEKSVSFNAKPVSLKKYLTRPDKSGIIAEFKRKSPSAGVINAYASVERTSIGYMQAGASALSVLTDREFFGGSNEDLRTARQFNFCPILRKDFIVDEYQVVESKSIGADAILLIAAALSPTEIKALTELAHTLGMEVVLEVHSENELKKNLDAGVDVIGVNNRDLRTFYTDLNISKRLASLFPKEQIRISESGIHSPQALLELKHYGYHGFLIGEAFMQHSRPEQAAKEFIELVTPRPMGNSSVSSVL